MCFDSSQGCRCVTEAYFLGERVDTQQLSVDTESAFIKTAGLLTATYNHLYWFISLTPDLNT